MTKLRLWQLDKTKKYKVRARPLIYEWCFGNWSCECDGSIYRITDMFKWSEIEVMEFEEV